jgi:hypothetical protein
MARDVLRLARETAGLLWVTTTRSVTPAPHCSSRPAATSSRCRSVWAIPIRASTLRTYVHLAPHLRPSNGRGNRRCCLLRRCRQGGRGQRQGNATSAGSGKRRGGDFRQNPGLEPLCRPTADSRNPRCRSMSSAACDVSRGGKWLARAAGAACWRFAIAAGSTPGSTRCKTSALLRCVGHLFAHPAL